MRSSDRENKEKQPIKQLKSRDLNTREHLQSKERRRLLKRPLKRL